MRQRGGLNARHVNIGKADKLVWNGEVLSDRRRERLGMLGVVFTAGPQHASECQHVAARFSARRARILSRWQVRHMRLV